MVPPDGRARRYSTEFAQRAGDFAIVAVAVQADIADGTVRSADVVVGGVGPLPARIDTGSLAGQPAAPGTWRAAGELAGSPGRSLLGRPTAAASIRKRLTATLVSRALAQAAGE